MDAILDILPPLSLKFGPWLAGGAVRRVLQGNAIDDGDMDFFFTHKGEWEKCMVVLDHYELVHKSDAARTYLVNGIKVQIIKRMFYPSLEKLFGDFDFTACQVATDGKEIAYADNSLADIQNMHLRLATVGRVTKQTIIGRMIKYVNHGFMPVGNLFSIITASSLQKTDSFAIFGTLERPSANYDHDAKVDETMEAKVFNADALDRAMENLGLEMPCG